MFSFSAEGIIILKKEETNGVSVFLLWIASKADFETEKIIKSLLPEQLTSLRALTRASSSTVKILTRVL
jgi:hypothetical protein